MSTIRWPLTELSRVDTDPLTNRERLILTLVVAMTMSPLMTLASMTVPGAVMIIGPV